MIRAPAVTSLLLFLLPAAALHQTALAQSSPAQHQPDMPRLRPGDACPVSKGSRTTVPVQQHIFGAGSTFFGAGPAYFALLMMPRSSDEARFPFDHRWLQKNGTYEMKTPWVSNPAYSGPITIEGRALDAGGRKLLFSFAGSAMVEQGQLTAPKAPSPELWSFWPSTVVVPGPGCYGIQLKTSAGTSVVIFEADLPQSNPTNGTPNAH